MKRLFQLIFVIALFFTFCLENVNACSFDSPPLRKEFRQSKLVFLGRVTNLEDYYVPNTQEKTYIPDTWRENFTEIKNKSIFTKVSFEIKKNGKEIFLNNKNLLRLHIGVAAVQT